jgi:cytoskeletal protein CcmA (bactofilin family)
MRNLRQCAVALVALLAIAPPGAASDEVESKAQQQDTDTFVAGEEVSTRGEISGSSVLAGGRIDSAARVHGDAVLFGGDIKVTGETDESLYAFGGDIDLNGRVREDVRVAGGQVTIGPAAEVLGDITIAGGRVDIEGKVAGEIRVAGGDVRLNGAVGGNVYVRAGQLQIGPNARIDGLLRYHTKEAPAVDPAATVKGGIEPRAERWYGRWTGSDSGIAGPGWFGLFVIGTIIILASPTLGGRLLGHWRTRTGAAIGFGLLCLLATPIALVLCAITIIGLPLAVVLLLAYLLALLVGHVSGLVALGQWGLARMAPARSGAIGWQILALAAALLVVGVLGRLPIVGKIVGLAVVVLGTGALLIELSRLMRSSETRAGA